MRRRHRGQRRTVRRRQRDQWRRLLGYLHARKHGGAWRAGAARKHHAATAHARQRSLHVRCAVPAGTALPQRRMRVEFLPYVRRLRSGHAMHQRAVRGCGPVRSAVTCARRQNRTRHTRDHGCRSVGRICVYEEEEEVTEGDKGARGGRGDFISLSHRSLWSPRIHRSPLLLLVIFALRKKIRRHASFTFLALTC